MDCEGESIGHWRICNPEVEQTSTSHSNLLHDYIYRIKVSFGIFCHRLKTFFTFSVEYDARVFKIFRFRLL